tara:strand:- start:4312 stop:5385 length:1074 start_codon:yes stop_codon:yes gene_type:complete
MSLSSQFDPLHVYEDIELEHYGEGWQFPQDSDTLPYPTTHGMIHLPGGKRIAVEGTWSGLQAPDARVGGTRPWEDFRFHALAEIGEDETRSVPFMDIGVMLDPNFTPERPEDPTGSRVAMGMAGRPVGVDLPALGGDDGGGYYPVEPPHSKVHTEGTWRIGRIGDDDFEPPGADTLGPRFKEVRRWAQDPGGQPQHPGFGAEFGTYTTERVAEEDLQSYRRGSRSLGQHRATVSPLEQVTDSSLSAPDRYPISGMGTLSSTTSDLYDFYTAELARYMHHLRGDSGDDYFERGTHGQDMPEPDEEPTDEEPTDEEPTDDLLESYYRSVYNVKPSRRSAFDAGHLSPGHTQTPPPTDPE